MIDKCAMIRGMRGLYMSFVENDRVYVRLFCEYLEHETEVYNDAPLHLPEWREVALLLIADWERATKPVIYATDVDRDVAWRTLQKHKSCTAYTNEFFDDETGAWIVTCVRPTEVC